MTSSIRTSAIASIFLALLLLPVASEAQARRAVPRAAPAGRPQSATVYRAPYNRPYYGGRYYGSRYYGPRYYGGFYYGYPYYSGGYAYYGAGYGFSIGAGFGYPYGYAYGYPYTYGYPYGYAYGYPNSYPYDLSSSLRLQVTPRETEVYIDGYPAGTVDDFDGTFQRLHVGPGNHTVELYLPGHRVFERNVLLQPGNTLSVRHAMEPLASGEAEPSRPVAPPLPPGESPDPDQPRERDRVSVSSAEFGSLALHVQPGGAQVTIDGEKWDSQDSDRLIVQLGPGVHNIEIRRDGFRTFITDITIHPNETTPLNVAMTRQ
jgi:hypothetical protein